MSVCFISYCLCVWNRVFNTDTPRQNDFADDIFKCIFLNENEWILKLLFANWQPLYSGVNILRSRWVDQSACFLCCVMDGCTMMFIIVMHNMMVSCQKGPTGHAYAWQIGPFWQDTLDIRSMSLVKTLFNFLWMLLCILIKLPKKTCFFSKCYYSTTSPLISKTSTSSGNIVLHFLCLYDLP